MAIVWVRPIHDGRGGEAANTSRVTRRFLIRTNDKTHNESTIFQLAAAQLPALYSPHPDNLFLLCKRLRIEQHSDSPLLWVATADFDNEPLPTSGPGSPDRLENPNPLDRRAKIRWSTNQYQVPVFRDIRGIAVVNSAGDYFDPPPETEESRWVANITKNVAEIPDWMFDGYQDSVNDAPFLIQGRLVDEGAAKIVNLEISDLQNENGIEFFTIAVSLEFKKLHPLGSNTIVVKKPSGGTALSRIPWSAEILDIGFNRIDPENVNARIPITLEDGSRPTTPWPLDGVGDPIPDPTPDNAVYLRYEFCERKDFSVLPLE